MNSIKCVICDTTIRCKIRGRHKKYCNSCRYSIERYQSIIHRRKHHKHILSVARKYRETHREEIRQKNTEWTRNRRQEQQEYNNKLLDDIIKNPRKYLKRI